MTDEVVLSRRAWLFGLAGKAAGRVAEAVEDRIPEQLLPAAPPSRDDVPGDDLPAIDAAEGGDELVGAVADLPPPTRLTLHSRRCIAIIGIDCGACARLCPDEVRGLWLARGRPVIDPEACVGCGACAEACPTSPSALELVVVAPREDNGTDTGPLEPASSDAEATADEDETPDVPDFSVPS